MKLAFPSIKNFAELFETILPSDAKLPDIPWLGRDWDNKKIKAKIGSYCYSSGCNHSLRVRPREFVVDYIKSNMVLINYDSIHFCLTWRNDGTVLVTAQHNQILGDCWLAVVPVESVPVFDRQE